MSVDLITWRQRVGRNNAFKAKKCNKGTGQKTHYFSFFFDILTVLKSLLFDINLSKTKNKTFCLVLPYIFLTINIWCIMLLLIQSGDVETNPGPLTLMHWNPNSLCAENFSRKTLIETLNFTKNYDIIAITESALHESIGNDNLKIPGYQIFRRDIPNTINHGGVLVYCKDSLSVTDRPDLEHNENQLILQLTIERKKIFLSVNYRKHHKNSEELSDFVENFKNSIQRIKNETPFCQIHVGDLNCHQKKWWVDDINDTPGDLLNEVITSENLFQMVNEPTHIVGAHRSCIDLVITDQPNLVNDCGILPSLHTRCHHQINNVEINLLNPPPPPYIRRIWHYQRANKNAIITAIESFNWKRSLSSLSDQPSKQAEFFSETLLNIFSNFIPNEYRKIKPRDPPWFTKNIKRTYQRYQRSYKKFKSQGFPPDKSDEINNLKQEYSNMVINSKEKYLVDQGIKLSKPETPVRSYWSTIKKFISPSATSIIPPLFINNSYIVNVEEKCNHFNDFFANQCTTLETGSEIPNFFLRTDKTLNNVVFSKSDLEDILKNLDPQKSHGFDEISIKMIQLCENSIIDPLFDILKNCVEKGTFPACWKKANLVPIHKKNQKNMLKNYRPISLLPIFGKVFEKLLFKSLYSFLIQNDLISPKQSGFIKGDSTINQLLSITEMINSSFDCDVPKEVRSVFLDISKAFDKVWHPGLLFKLKQNGIDGKMYQLLENFLSDRKQRVTLNGKMSSWKNVQAGVPQGSVLGPILFLLYINDLIPGLKSDARVFADDTSLFMVVDDINTAHATLDADLKYINQWADQWRFEFNPDPAKPPIELIFSTKTKPPIHPPLYFNESRLTTVVEHKHLGLILDKKLTFESHTREKINKARRLLGALKRSSQYLPVSALDRIYKSFIRPQLEYGDIIYHRTPSSETELLPLKVENLPASMKKLESVQYQAALVVCGAWKGSSKHKVYKELGWEHLSHRRWLRQQTIYFKIVNGLTPNYLKINTTLSLSLRNSSKLINNIQVRTKRYEKTFYPSCIFSWNNILSPDQRMSISTNQFKAKLNAKIKQRKTDNFGIFFKKDLKYLYQLRVGLSALKMHKFLHNFADTESDQCPFMDGREDTFHFLIECNNFYTERKILFNSVYNASGINLLLTPREKIVNILLYGEPTLSRDVNKKILLSTIWYIHSTERLSSL